MTLKHYAGYKDLELEGGGVLCTRLEDGALAVSCCCKVNSLLSGCVLSGVQLPKLFPEEDARRLMDGRLSITRYLTNLNSKVVEFYALLQSVAVGTRINS